MDISVVVNRRMQSKTFSAFVRPPPNTGIGYCFGLSSVSNDKVSSEEFSNSFIRIAVLSSNLFSPFNFILNFTRHSQDMSNLFLFANFIIVSTRLSTSHCWLGNRLSAKVEKINFATEKKGGKGRLSAIIHHQKN